MFQNDRQFQPEVRFKAKGRCIVCQFELIMPEKWVFQVIMLGQNGAGVSAGYRGAHTFHRKCAKLQLTPLAILIILKSGFQKKPDEVRLTGVSLLIAEWDGKVFEGGFGQAEAQEWPPLVLPAGRLCIQHQLPASINSRLRGNISLHASMRCCIFRHTQIFDSS